jgi:hypothetical protein
LVVAYEDQSEDADSSSSDAPGSFRSETTVQRYPFRVTLRRSRGGSGQDEGVAVATRSDAPPGEEETAEQHAGLFEQIAAVPGAESTAAAPGPEDEATALENTSATPGGAATPIQIPDIEFPALAAVGKSDAINGAFTYSGSIAEGGAAPSGFGVTRSFSSKLSGITITPNSGTFDVTATYEHPITYQVRASTGPSGQKDIASDTDGDITDTNYPTVVSDLTPNMSDLNGRPPRTSFWAKDLTLKHEKVHADDDKANGPGAMATVTTWLNGQAAANEAGVRTKLAALPGRFATALLAALSTEAGEKHAYGDGAPSYTARANSIKAKGDKGDYP